MSSATPHYNQEVPIHNQGPAGTKPYCVPEGEILHCTASYPYKRLRNDHQFRLLKLLPRFYEHPMPKMLGLPRSQYLCGTLSDHDLAEDVSYECLSYVWGTAHTGSVLWLDTYMIAISDNLDMALRCLVDKTEPRMVWVDFVCINQDDYNERKQQVELMYRLYSKAEKVIAYLGHEADDSEDLPALLERIHEAHFKDAEDKGNVDQLSIKPWKEDDWIRMGLPPTDDEAWVALKKFISRPWFVRVWIMQEALAAKDLFVICGLWLSPAHHIFQTIGIAIARCLPMMPRRSQSEDIYQNAVACGLKQLNLLLELGICGILGRDNESWPLIDVLERSRHASCTDPRDRVFALLNISKDSPQLGIRPDYTANVADSYKFVARALVIAGKGHRVLCNAWMSNTVLEIPSWVPDWSLKGAPFDTLSPCATSPDQSSHFKAGGTEHSIHLGENLDELVAKAHGIGHVHILGQKFEFEEKPPPALLLKTHEQAVATGEAFMLSNEPPAEGRSETSSQTETSPFVEKLNNEAPDDDWSKYPNLFHIFGIVESLLRNSLSPLYKNKDEIEILWRTMICDRELRSQRRAPAYYDSYFRSYLEQIKFHYGLQNASEHVIGIRRQILDSPLKDQIQSKKQLQNWVLHGLAMEREEANLFEQAAWRFCHLMRVVITDSGYVGMVPRCTQKGDVAAVIKGVSVPIVLRQEGADRFKVVGQAYFWGFMDGEVFEMDDMEEEEIVLI